MSKPFGFADSTPVEEAAFSIAALEYPNLHFPTYRKKLDRFGAKLVRQVPALKGVRRAQLLFDFVLRTLGFRGCADFEDPRTNFLNDVIDRRVASPVAMAIILMAIGRRAGIDVKGIDFTGHFLVRIEGHYADPFVGFAPLSRTELLKIARQTFHTHREAVRSLEPADTTVIAERLLINLWHNYDRRGDHGRALVVSDYLFDLTQLPIYLVDRGIHALALGAARSAIHDFEACLSIETDGEIAERARKLLDRARALTPEPIN